MTGLLAMYIVMSTGLSVLMGVTLGISIKEIKALRERVEKLEKGR